MWQRCKEFEQTSNELKSRMLPIAGETAVYRKSVSEGKRRDCSGPKPRVGRADMYAALLALSGISGHHVERRTKPCDHMRRAFLRSDN
jgi:hypothetical protein